MWASHDWSLKLGNQKPSYYLDRWPSELVLLLVSLTHDHAIPCCAPSPLVETLVVWAYKRFLEWSSTHKKAGVCRHAYVTGAQKRTHVYHPNVPNYHTSTFLGCGMWGMYGFEGVWFKVTTPSLWLADLYAPQEVNLGGGGSSSYWFDTVQIKGLNQKLVKVLRL